MQVEGENLGAKEKLTFSLGSRFWGVFLTLLAVVLIFVGPTYVILVLWRGLDLDYTLSVTAGLLLFLIGSCLLVFLVKKRIIS